MYLYIVIFIVMLIIFDSLASLPINIRLPSASNTAKWQKSLITDKTKLANL